MKHCTQTEAFARGRRMWKQSLHHVPYKDKALAEAWERGVEFERRLQARKNK